MTDKKIKMDKLWGALVCVFFSSVLLTILLLYLVLIASDPHEFLLDNARYFYSAVFQGFAALLALILTAILITLQNMNSQRYNVEERVYKILENHFPTYVPDTIEGIKRNMQNDLFNTTFTACVKEKSKLPPKSQVLLVKRITNELNGMFNYFDDWKKHKSKLHGFFVASVLSSMFVLLYSVILLISVNSDTSLPFTLFLGSSLVVITIGIFVIYLFQIIEAWRLTPESFRT